MKFELNLEIDIGNTLRKYRLTNSLTQQAVSNYLDISRQAYRQWEENKINFSISQLNKIARLYKLPLHVIIIESYYKKIR